MKLEKLIVYSTLACIIFSTLGLVLSAQIALPNRLIYSMALILAAAYQVFTLRWNRWIFNFAALLILVLSLVYGIWFAEYPILAAIYFIGYVILLRAFELETPRDFKFALLLSLFEISAASLMMISLRYFFLFLAWLIAALFSWTLVTIYSRAPVKKPIPAPGRLLELVTAAAFFSVVFGMVLFFFLPRIGFSFISLPMKSERAWSGYSPTITVGEVSRLLEDRTPVMRVSTDKDQPIAGVKWRMRAMEYYEIINGNGAWQDRLGVADVYPSIYNQPVTVDLKPPAGLQLTQEIYLEPGIGPDLPAAAVAYAYQVPYKFRSVRYFFNHYVELPVVPYERIHYLAYSSMPEYTRAQINSSLGSIDQFMEDKKNHWVEHLMELPKNSEPICKLAEQVAGKEREPAKKIDAIQAFFEKNFKYSLADLPTGPSAINDFLFKSRKGDCEYFATAGALMLRCLKIPNRMAAGFISGEWNDSQKYYLVRESDAHTWVEIYLPGEGFMDFDPTPEAGRKRVSKSSFFWKIFDPINFRWNRWIVEFSVQDQLRGLRRIEAQSTKVQYSADFRVPELRFWLRRNPLVAAGIIVLISGTVFLGFWFRERIAQRKMFPKDMSPEAQKVAQLYLEMFEILRRKGVERKDSLTGYETAERIKLPAAQTIIRRITQFYYQVRFGKTKALEKHLEQAKNDLEELKKQMSSTSK